MQAPKIVTSTLKTATVKQTAVTFSATFINGTLGFLFYVVTARFLGPESFGILTVSLTVLALVADIGNFGINAGIVNFVSKYKNSDIALSRKYLKLSLELKLLFGLITILAGYFLAPPISFYFFHKPELILPLRLSFAGVATTWLFSFATSYFQAFEKFISWGIIQIISNLARLTAIILFYYFSVISVNSAIIGYILTPLFGFLLALFFIPKNFIGVKGETKLVGNFFAFNKWVGFSAIASSLSSKIDTFILAALLTNREVGIYSAAYQIVQVVPQLISALGTVVAPKFASFGDSVAAKRYFYKTQKMVGVICLLGLSGIPVFKILIPLLMGERYNDSFVVFSVLLVGMLIFLFATPIHNCIIYYYNYPKILTTISFVNLGIMLSVGYFATVRFGVVGMALATVVINLINLVVPAIWIKRKI